MRHLKQANFLGLMKMQKKNASFSWLALLAILISATLASNVLHGAAQATGLSAVSVSNVLPPDVTYSDAGGQPDRLLWGDTHLHTSYSFDAFLNQNHSADPDTAYRWAKGLPVIHPYNRTRVQIETPLDFLVVADHAETMGVIRALVNDTAELSEVGFFKSLLRRIYIYFLLDAVEDQEGKQIFADYAIPVAPKNPGAPDPVVDPNNEMNIDLLGDTTAVETTAWHEIIDAAERHNDPGQFTSLLGWEWSSTPTGANLHRVVLTPDGADKAKQFLPFGSDQSQYPEDLWQWLEQTQAATGARFIAIPHNSNISKGYMFGTTTLKGQPITANYARQRVQWEPIVEVTQIKGDSETHPDFSPDDEFADFEPYEFYIQQTWESYRPKEGDYIRPTLKQGLAIEQQVGVNPYQFGLIGATDSHTGMASAEEYNFWGKMATDSTPETKRGGLIRDAKDSATGWHMAAGGLAAVWAYDNTREEIFAAFKRKEVYATTGPRISVRVFAGWNFNEADVVAQDFASVGYAKGVPMGSGLLQSSQPMRPLQLLIRAVKDPLGGNLDRVQVVKGWVDASGQTHEKIFNVAFAHEDRSAADGGTLRELTSTGELTTIGSTVDESVPTYTNTIGAAELSTLWSDPEFDAEQRAFYYVRVLQIPTPRHSLYDAVALQIEAPEEAPATIQERAYTSPIWYSPSSSQ